MANNIKLLDCTLRDGGSINDWNFGYDNIVNILQCLNSSNIEIVEMGFLQNGYSNSNDLSISDSTKIFDEKLKRIKNKNFKAVAMIDFDKFDINMLPPKNETLIDGIRLMFKKREIEEAVKISKKIKEKGYSLSLNPVSVTSYSFEEIKKLCKIANDISPDVIYIIDTYGLLDNEKTLEYYNIFDCGLINSIEIGYHAHNNLQSAYSNSIAIINNSKDRNIVIDGSLYGMGKRAGNTPIELLCHYLNSKTGKKYNLNNLNRIIENTIMPLHKHFEWGYSLFHYIAAINGCHSDYVTFLYNEMKYNPDEITSILKLIPENKKLTFDKKYLLSNIIGEKNGTK